MLAVSASLLAGQMVGCTPDEEHKDIPPAGVKTVTAYNVTLDESATPQQAVYVMLRSIADDVHAAQKHDHDAQKEAMRREHSVLAFSLIEQRLLQMENMGRKQPKDSLGPDHDSKLWDFSRQLAPIVAHYVPSFDTTFEAAVSKMQMRGNPESPLVHVLYAASHDPNASDPQERDPVLIDFEVAKENVGGKTFWRIAKISFAGRDTRMVPTTQSATQHITNKREAGSAGLGSQPSPSAVQTRQSP